MASKAAIVNSEERPSSIKKQEPGALANATGSASATWSRFTGFLSDVKAEMRKVVAPSRKEVEATTTVVIVTVFIFGLFFFLTDSVFNWAVGQVLHKLGAQ